MDNSADYDYEDIRYSAGPMTSMSNPDKNQYTTFSTLDVMINWVNSFEYPSCLLASQICDLKDVNEIILKNQIPDFLPKIVSNDPSHDEKLHNSTMALSEIKSMREYPVPQNIKELKSHELLQDENKIMILLKFLYDIANNKIAPNNSSQASGKKPGVQAASEHNFISDSYNNRSDLYSNNSTQPSPISMISGPKVPQKPPLNPSATKMKSPTNAALPRKSERVTQEQSPRQFDGSPIAMEYQERDTFSDIDITQTYANASGRRGDQAKLPSDLYNQYFSSQSQTDYGYQQTFDYSPEFLTNDPHEGEENGHDMHHDLDGRESSVIVNDFSNLEMPRSTVPIEPSAGARRKSNKNISKSFSRNDRDYQQQNFVNQYAEYFERAQMEMHPSYESERYSYPFTSEIHNQSPFNPESHRTDQASTNRGLNESRIMPMEVQQQRRMVQQREEYDDIENSHFMESHQTYESAPNQKKRKSKSQAHYPAPETLEINPSEYLNQERKPYQPVPKKRENKEVVIAPVADDIKKKLLGWLCTIGLLKENIKGLDKKLPKVCKNGLLFIDLINRLEGKNETIKGITRNSKTKSQVNSNYFKVMEYLRGFEKMNPRYLQAQEHLLDGNEDVFWGFLDDLWSLYNHKISPFDPRYKVQKEKVKPKTITPKARTDSIKIAEQLKVPNTELSYNDICCYNNPGTTTAKGETTLLPSTKDKSAPPSKRLSVASKRQEEYDDILVKPNKKDKSRSPPRYQEEEASPQLFEHVKRTSEIQDDLTGLRVRQDSANNRMEIKTDFVNNSPKGKKPSPLLDSYTPTTTKSVAKRYGSYTSGSPMCVPKASQENMQFSTNEEQCISIDVEIMVTDWLKQLGFKALLMRERKTLFDDPFRNGTLLCYVIGRVENEKMQGIYKEPKSIDECRSNVYKAFQVLRKKHIPIPSFLNGREESILKGSRSVTLTLLYSLMKTQKNKAGPSPITNSIEKGKYEVSGDIPPYNETEIEQLELSLINWLDGLGFLQGVSYRPTSIRELANHLKNGVILYDLASMITNEKMGSIHRRPTSEAHFLTNIRKALEILRNQKNIGQKYLWKEKEIFKGNKYIILGLLEDMQRFYDNMPPRKNPHYFSEGPYIAKLARKDDVQRDLSRERSKAAAFESALNHSVYARLNTSNYDHNANQSRIVPRETTMSSNYNATQPNEELRTRNSVLNISSDEPISLMNNTRKSEIPSTTTSNKATERFSNLRSAPQSRRERGSEKGPRVSFVNDDMQFEMMERSPISIDKGTLAGGQFKEWLISLGLIDLVRYIDFDEKVIDDLKDGYRFEGIRFTNVPSVVLCKIIEKVEMKQIPGVIVKPRTNASRMVNIRKCLNVLSKRPGVNPHYLHCEDKILAGDGPTIRKLLSSIKDAYKFVNKCIAKPRSRSSSRNLDSSIGELRNHQMLATPSELWNNRGTPDNFNREVHERKRMLIPTPKSKY